MCNFSSSKLTVSFGVEPNAKNVTETQTVNDLGPLYNINQVLID